MVNPIVFVEDIVALRPCGTEDPADGPYSEERIRQLFGARQSVTALDILHHPEIPVEDMFWVVLRPELIKQSITQEFADFCADWVVERFALTCGIPEVEEWAARWLSGEDRSYVGAAGVWRLGSGAGVWRPGSGAWAVAAEAAGWAAWAESKLEAGAWSRIRAAEWVRITRAVAAEAAAVAAEMGSARAVEANKIFHEKLIEMLEGK